MSSRKVVVLIRDLELLARIGVHGHEQGKLQPVRINVALTGGDGRRAATGWKTPSITKPWRRRSADSMAAGHINLAETLAERIAAACFEDRRVRHARIRVEKLHALPGAEAAGVEIERDAPG